MIVIVYVLIVIVLYYLYRYAIKINGGDFGYSDVFLVLISSILVIPAIIFTIILLLMKIDHNNKKR